jgi:hypothetical protein
MLPRTWRLPAAPPACQSHAGEFTEWIGIVRRRRRSRQATKRGPCLNAVGARTEETASALALISLTLDEVDAATHVPAAGGPQPSVPRYAVTRSVARELASADQPGRRIAVGSELSRAIRSPATRPF